METIACEHIEIVKEVPELHTQVARCSVCGQVRQFRVEHPDSTVITKLGRIGDKIVMPKAGIRLELTPEESRLVREGWDSIEEAKEEEAFRKKIGTVKKGEM